MKRLCLWVTCLAASIVHAACLAGVDDKGQAEGDSIDALAERYVKTVLALGQHDPDYVDVPVRPNGAKKPRRRSARSIRSTRTRSHSSSRWRRRLLPLTPPTSSGSATLPDEAGECAADSRRDVGWEKADVRRGVEGAL